MNTDKLLKAIQILVEEEVKRQLPKVLAEMKSKSSKKAIVEKIKSKHIGEGVSSPSMVKAILGEAYQKPKSEVQYTKNPMINQILNETKNTPAYPGATNGFEEWPIMNSPIANVNPANNVESIRASMAQKMGYGDMASGNGLGVDTGNEVLNKAFNRDYSELVKRFK
jgi:hypothetical protein